VFFVLSKLLDVFLSPFTWGLGLVAAGIAWRRPRPDRFRRRRLFGLAGIAVLLFFSLEPVSNGMLYRLEQATTSTMRPDVVYDAIALLGGVSDERVVAERGAPAFNENIERLIVTQRLLAEGRAKLVIISGGPMEPRYADYNEARVLGDQLRAWGIAPAQIVLEERARNTHENALFIRDIARDRGLSDILVVTSAFHMRRAVECFAAVDMRVDTLAVDYRAHHGPVSLVPRAMFLSESTMTIREAFGLYVYRARGYARPVTAL
jgi:uncharacterized SAM-binding protein YcdF (DUF218 family)